MLAGREAQDAAVATDIDHLFQAHEDCVGPRARLDMMSPGFARQLLLGVLNGVPLLVGQSGTRHTLRLKTARKAVEIC